MLQRLRVLGVAASGLLVVYLYVFQIVVVLPPEAVDLLRVQGVLRLLPGGGPGGGVQVGRGAVQAMVEGDAP